MHQSSIPVGRVFVRALTSIGLVTAVLLALPMTAAAQARIEGRVTDAGNNPVGGATVSATTAGAQSAAPAVRTDADGTFAVEGVSAGTYVLTVEAAGFRRAERRVTTNAAGLSGLVIQLDVAVTATVTVLARGPDADRPLDIPSETGSRLGLTARELPASLQVIPQAVMQARGHRTAGEAIESAVGVTVGDSPGNPANFSTRGFTNNQVSVLHDGIRVGPPSMVSRPVDVWNLERIDVLKGPASTLFGEGAVGGAVNYVFKRPDRGPARAEGEISYGGFNTFRLGLGAGGPLGREGLHYRVDYSLNDSDGFIDRTPSRLQSLTSALAWEASPRFDAQISFDVLDDTIDPYWGTPLVPRSATTDPIDGVVRTADGATIDRRMSRVNYNVGDNVMDSTTYWTRARIRWRPSARTAFRNEVYYLSADREWLNAETYAFNPATNLVDRDRFYVAHDQSIAGNRFDVQLQHPIGGYANRFLAGFDVNQLDFFRPSFFADGDSVNRYTPATGVFGPLTPADQTADITNASFFAEDSFALRPDLKLSAGLRAERLDLDRRLFNTAGVLNTAASFSRVFTPTTWKVGAVYDVTRAATFYGHVATSADPVNTNLFIVRSRENFGLTRGFEVEFGVKQQLPRGLGDWTAAVYRIERQNILTQTSLTTADPVGQQSSRGVELSAVLRPTRRWQLQANAAFVGAEYDDFSESAGAAIISRNGNRPFNVPNVVVGAWGSYRLFDTRPLELGLSYRHVGDRFTTTDNSIRLLAYDVVELFGRWTVGRARLTARVRNLFDEEYAVWGDNFYPTQVLLGAPRAAEIALSFGF